MSNIKKQIFFIFMVLFSINTAQAQTPWDERTIPMSYPALEARDSLIAPNIYTKTQIDSLKPPEMILSNNGNQSFSLTNYKNGNSTGNSNSAFGSGANQNSTGDEISGFGHRANFGSTGDDISGFGLLANFASTGDDISGFGYGANFGSTGHGISGFGYRVNGTSTGDKIYGFGYRANEGSTGNNLVSIGNSAGRGDTKNNQLKIEMRNLSSTPLVHGDFLKEELYLPTVQVKQNFIDANGISLQNGEILQSDGTQMNAAEVVNPRVQSASLDFSSLGISQSQDLTINVSCEEGDAFVVSPPAELSNYSDIQLTYFISAPNIVTIRASNVGNSTTIDMPALEYNVTILDNPN